ncbi:hypothetical protein Aduo_000273 [Ancylostoma duodenale]
MSGTIVPNVGGKKSTTALDTLKSMKSGENTFFADLDPTEGEIFIDRDPSLFKYILSYLQEGRVIIPEGALIRKLIMEEAKFYGFENFAKMTKRVKTGKGYQVIDVKKFHDPMKSSAD